MNKKNVLYTIILSALLLIYFSCDIKYNLTDHILDINNSSWRKLGDDQGTNNTLGISRLFVVNEVPFLAYVNNINDASTDDDVVKVKRYYNNIWQPLNGFPNLPVLITSKAPISMSYKNNLHVSYVDAGKNGRLVEYNFGTWTEKTFQTLYTSAITVVLNNEFYTVYKQDSGIISAFDHGTTRNFTNGSLATATATFKSTARPYTTPVIAYIDMGNDIIINGYDEVSNNWDFNISDISLTGPTNELSIRGSGTNLYVSYKEGTNVYVKKFNDFPVNSWDDVGGNIFTNANIYYERSLAAYGDYVYLAYQDTTNSNKATVVRCRNNGNWETVGEKGFTPHSAYNISIYISNGIPFISYHKDSPNGKIVVMKYE